MEDQIRLLEAELGMPLQTSRGRSRGGRDLNLTAGLVRRLQTCGEKLEVIRESGVRFLQEELDEVKESRNNVSAALRAAQEKIEQLESSGGEAGTRRRGSVDARRCVF